MAPIYVDETAGSDLTGVGSQEAPYQSLAYALFTQGHSVTVLIRKDPSADYEEPTQSALKKAKKGADGLEKKRKKAEELAEREARARGEDREKRERLLEESRKIQLVEDATLPTAIRVRTTALVRRDPFIDHPQAKILNLNPLRGKRIRVFGWVHRLRSQKDIIFIVLRDGTGYLQAVLSGVPVRNRLSRPFWSFCSCTNRHKRTQH
jgi:asparaginyl-tRNA synthetase